MRETNVWFEKTSLIPFCLHFLELGHGEYLLYFKEYPLSFKFVLFGSPLNPQGGWSPKDEMIKLLKFLLIIMPMEMSKSLPLQSHIWLLNSFKDEILSYNTSLKKLKPL